MPKCPKFLEGLFSYKTPKIVQINSISIGVISRLIQLSIFIYIVGYVIIYNKGYQDVSPIEGFVTTKVRGVIYTNYSDDEFDPKIQNPEWYRRIWGPADYVVPPTRTMAVFIATNIIITRNQTQGVCAEDPFVPKARCTNENNHCVAGTVLRNGNGLLTGNCVVHPAYNESTCEILSWCPTEVDELPLRNIKDTVDGSYLKNCSYDPDFNPDCPIFTLRDIVERTEIPDYDLFAKKGGIISITINWDCNFDYRKEDCLPTYQFSALSNPHAKVATGWNFRHAIYFSDTVRTLHKMYGIRFAFSVIGQAGKFGIVPLLSNIGSGLGLFAIGVVVCDVVVLHLVKQGDYFKAKKYEAVDPESSTVSGKKAVKKRKA